MSPTQRLSGQVIAHLEEMAEHQHAHGCPMGDMAWDFLNVLREGPLPGGRFTKPWADFVQTVADWHADENVSLHPGAVYEAAAELVERRPR